MTLNDKTKIGMTFGQLLAIISLFVTLGVTWMNMNVRVANIEVEVEQIKKTRADDLHMQNVFRAENREDHAVLTEKIDAIYRVVVSQGKY